MGKYPPGLGTVAQKQGGRFPGDAAARARWELMWISSDAATFLERTVHFIFHLSIQHMSSSLFVSRSPSLILSVRRPQIYPLFSIQEWRGKL